MNVPDECDAPNPVGADGGVSRTSVTETVTLAVSVPAWLPSFAVTVSAWDAVFSYDARITELVFAEKRLSQARRRNGICGCPLSLTSSPPRG